jgi:uncharacterized protein YbjT (DUF2867 family)
MNFKMGKRANVIGATGLVGRELVTLLLENPEVEKVTIFSRRDSGFQHEKLEQRVIDFDDRESWKPFLQGDVLFSTLGTTLKQAGSKEKQYLVDYTYQWQFAEAAADKGIPSYVLVSSTGADPRSSIFYSRIKGELDEAVQALPFEKTIILRPSILKGEREIKRGAESWSACIMDRITRLVFKRYRPIPGRTVAKAMINAAFGTVSRKIYTLDEIFPLAEEN